MNETELDELLNQWQAPEPGAELRGRIRGLQPRRRRFAWPSWHLSKGLLAGVAAGAVMCLFGISVAFPQVFARSSIRFNLLSEFRVYHNDGSFTVREQRASTAVHGSEIILQRYVPDNTFMNVHMMFFDMFHRLLGMNEVPAPARMASDCSVPDASVTGHETVLGYRTTVLQYPPDPQDRSRYREWRSPELDCIVMKWIVEEPRANGGFRIASERKPLVVRINRPQ
jgi:hypothetical protein